MTLYYDLPRMRQQCAGRLRELLLEMPTTTDHDFRYAPVGRLQQ